MTRAEAGTGVKDILEAAGTEQDVPGSSLHEGLFARLDASIGELWSRAREGAFWRHVTERGFDRDLYGIAMTQIYHYTRHNSVNQAVAALRAGPEQSGLLRFVYTHARDELGHEKLVLHDLRAIGLLGAGEQVESEPLAATDALVNYLYGIALREGPVARLGYSYWAESVYEHIGPLLATARESLNLGDADMAFFVAHSDIDARHAAEVVQTIRREVTCPAEAEAVHRVAVTTLWLTICLLEQSHAEWSLRRATPRRGGPHGG